MKHEKKQDALMEKLTLAEAGSSTPDREGLKNSFLLLSA